MAHYEKMHCANCKYYEMFHRYPNPNAIATHYCKKCNEEIRYVKDSPITDNYIVWIPKRCYFNNFFVESEESKKERESRYFYSDYGLFCQVED